MTLHTGQGWTTKLINKKSSSSEVKTLKKEMTEYWKEINEKHTRRHFPSGSDGENGNDRYVLRLSHHLLIIPSVRLFTILGGHFVKL